MAREEQGKRMSTIMGLDPGTVIGRDFKVVRLLASGAMGSVYIVEQLSTGKQRAMKVMSVELAQNERARERFVLEAKVGSQIDSDHVVEVVTAGIDEELGVPYLVMELLKGEELGELILREGALPLRDVAEILKQAGHALEQAHAQGIVHRDLKPENMFIAESRREGVPFTVKILDFGIAKLVAERTHEGTQPVGTPLFMSPEQTDRRGRIGPPTDVWPLGLMAFYMLTGAYYWRGIDHGVTALLREVVLEPLDLASERAAAYGMRDRLPTGFDGWFARCVHRDPDRRFPDAGEATRAFAELVLDSAPAGRLGTDAAPSSRPVDRTAADLAVAATAIASTEPGVSNTVGAPASRGKPPVAAIAAAAVVGIGVAGYFATRGGPAPAPPPPPVATTSVAAPAPTASASAAAKAPCPEGMVLVKGGNMFMGSKDEDLEDDVRPPHKVTVASFCLDVHEVSVAAYEGCSASGNCLRAPETVDYPGATAEEKKQLSTLCTAGKKDRAQHPINCVDWSMAESFCKTAGGRLPEGGARLPTEAEWELAARGSGQRTYPWGDDPPGPKRLNACGSECLGWHAEVKLKSYGSMYDGDDGYAGTAPLGSFPGGVSSGGVHDLAGNVWEWVADWYAPYTADTQIDPKGPASGAERVVRGGGFNGLKPSWVKPAYRWKTDPKSFSHAIGFRCAAGAS